MADGLSADQRLCVTPRCGRPATKRRRCSRCYQRWWKASTNAERPAITTVERFWEKVRKDGPIPMHAPELGGCWEWTGARRPSGHGQFGTLPAHVYALELALGQPRPDGTEGCHRCDNPSCVRPSHIYFGTRQNNVDDAWGRGRHQIGSGRPAARLLESQVEEIRQRYAAGESGSLLAAEFGLKPCSIYGITSGLKWPNAPGPITRKKA